MVAGKIKQLIDKIILERSGGNAVVVNTTKVKLKLKGIEVDAYDSSTADDPSVVKKLEEIAKEWDIQL